MSADKLTDEQRRARALTLDEAAAKIKAEYGEALATLGAIPSVHMRWDYTPEQHVEFARSRGVELSLAGQRIQREYLDLVAHATNPELTLLASVLSMLLDLDRARELRRHDLIADVIAILSTVECKLERRERQRRRAARDARYGDEVSTAHDDNDDEVSTADDDLT